MMLLSRDLHILFLCFFIEIVINYPYNTNIHIKMSPKFNGSSNNSGSNTTSSVIAITGLNLALSYENAAIDRLEKRLSESIIPEVKDRLKRHLEQTREQQERLRERIKALGSVGVAIEPTYEKGRLPIPEPPRQLKMMIESTSSDKEREVWESLIDLIIERAEAIMYEGGIQALELLKIDKKTIKALQRNLKEEVSFGDWLEKNNPKIAKRLMTRQMEEKKKYGKKKMVTQDKQETISTTVTAST
jgi:ferritin-like metal-binding protein YciE